MTNTTTQPWLRAELIAAPETTPGAQLMIPADGVEFHDDQLVFHHQGEVVYVADQGQLRSITWFAKQPNPETGPAQSPLAQPRHPLDRRPTHRPPPPPPPRPRLARHQHRRRPLPHRVPARGGEAGLAGPRHPAADTGRPTGHGRHHHRPHHGPHAERRSHHPGRGIPCALHERHPPGLTTRGHHQHRHPTATAYKTLHAFHARHRLAARRRPRPPRSYDVRGRTRHSQHWAARPRAQHRLRTQRYIALIHSRDRR